MAGPIPANGARAVGDTVVPLVVKREHGERTVRARASLALSGLLATSPEALRRRLFGPWSEGLRQYLAIRFGDLRRSDEAFAALRRLVMATPTAELVREPGAKAHVYRLARRIVRERHTAAVGLTSQRRHPFRAPTDASREYLDAITMLRLRLDDESRELLELRHARELLPEELACVYETDVDTIISRLVTARDGLRELLGAQSALADDHRLFVDAFALVPWPDEVERHDDTPRLEVGTLVGGRYRVVSRVGAGAFGEVYKADDEDVPGHRIALKILREPALSQSARDEALRELKLIAAVFHPSVVHFKDHGWYEDRLWFVMPWYEGESLERRVKRTNGLTRLEARHIFEPLARALATLHANGIRHQDIKPENVFLARIKGFASHERSEEDTVLPVLLDLGVAAKEHEALIGGTPVYFPPEVAAHYAQRKELRSIGAKADVFALALSLRNALEPETEEDVPAGAIEAFIERRADQPPPPPTRRDLRYLKGHFERWLALDPDQRPTAEEFAKELQMLTAPEERRTRRRRTLAWFVPLSLSFGAIVSAVVYDYRREAEHQARVIEEVRAEADVARAQYLQEETRRLALDQDHADLMRRYEENTLTRAELNEELATTRRQTEILSERLATAMNEREVVHAELELTHARVSQLESQVIQTRQLFTNEEQRVRDLERALAEEIDSHRSDSNELRSEADTARARLRDIESDLESARQERDRADDRVRELESRLDVAAATRSRLENELENVRGALDDLRARRSRVNEEATSARLRADPDMHAEPALYP